MQRVLPQFYDRTTRTSLFEFIAMESHIPIPFPGSPVVSGKSLTPARNIGIGRVPIIEDDNFFTLEGIFRIEPSEFLFKRSNLWNIQHDRIAVGPINAPKSCFGIE